MANGGRGRWTEGFERDLRRMGRMTDTMRFRYGLPYDECRKWVQDMLGREIETPEWDAVMYQVDNMPRLLI